MDVPLVDLKPTFLKRVDDQIFVEGVSFADADGLMFLCPKCFVEGGRVSRGVHSVICWKPHVPQTTSPIPGRWNMQGTGLHDLTLVAGSSSIALQGEGCKWHGFLQNGICTNA